MIGTKASIAKLGNHTLERIYSAAEAALASAMPEDSQLWAEVKHSNFSLGKATNLDGHLNSYRLGVEKSTSSRVTVGLAVDRIHGELAHDTPALEVSGKIDLTGYNLNPYILWTNDRARAWSTIGYGVGELEYDDTHKSSDGITLTSQDKADTEFVMLGFGSEYDFMLGEYMEMIGRIDIMGVQMRSGDGKKGLFNRQRARVYGLRGEVESGWPFKLDAGQMRPYLTVGFRLDGGDEAGSGTLEFGVGVTLNVKDFTLDSAFRGQNSPKDGDFEKTSFNLALSYDSGSDNQGLMLKVSHDYGHAEFDPFAAALAGSGELGGSSALGQDNINVEIGYGFLLGSRQSQQASDKQSAYDDFQAPGADSKQLLTLNSQTQFNQGVLSVMEYGLRLNKHTHSFELTYSIKPAVGMNSKIDALLLKYDREL